jgi:hypothetical protein
MFSTAILEARTEPETTNIATVPPWFANPSHLITWWDMEQFSARNFFFAGCLIEAMKTECFVASAVTASGEEPLFNLAAPLDQMAIDRAINYLQQIEQQCRGIGLDLSADTVGVAWKRLGQPSSRLNYQWLRDKVSDLKDLIAREMKNHGFFHISPEKGKYWPRMDSRNALGDSVADAFPSTFFDAGQAGMCLAIGIGTASVFHSMRVLEIGLTAFAVVFGISMAHTNWEPAIREIESKVRDMHKDPVWKALPDCKTKQEQYSQAASHFAVLKDAWRNYTMHARGKHAEDEAEMIFLNVRGFMQKLAALGLKEVI